MVIHNPLHMAPIEISAVGVKQDDIDEWPNLFLMHYTISSSEDLLNSLVNWVKGYLVLGDASGDGIRISAPTSNLGTSSLRSILWRNFLQSKLLKNKGAFDRDW